MQRARPAADRVFKILQQDIVGGKYQANTYLPSENQLCELLGASRRTIRATLLDLKNEGLIRINRGKGSYVVDQKKKLTNRILITTSYHVNTDMGSEEMQILMGICEGASKNGVEAIIAFDALKNVEDIIDRYVSGVIDGLIYIECINYKNEIAPFEKAGIPVVVANLENDISCVSLSVDFREVGRLAGRHLLKNKHKECAALMGEEFLYQEMGAGFRGALAEEGLFLQDDDIFGTKSDLEVLSASKRILKSRKKYTAVFIGRDRIASIFYQACHELSMEIPRDISVISYDNLSWSDGERQQLTSIAEPTHYMGCCAVNLLCEWIKGPKRPESVVLSAKLIERRSVKKRSPC